MARRRAPAPSISPAAGDDPGALSPQVAAPLYALPPDQFLAARQALVEQLAAAGDPRAAAAGKLRRPVGLAWVLNHLALAHRREVEALLRAGDRLRAGQEAALEGKGALALRAAEQEVRSAARALRLAAAPALEGANRRVEPATMGHLEVLVRALATAPDEVRTRFARGLLEREPERAGAFDALSGWAGTQAAPAPAAPPHGDRGGRHAAEEPEQHQERDERERQRREAARHHAEHEDAAARRRAEAEVARRRAEEEAAAAEARRRAEEEAARRRAEEEAARRRAEEEAARRRAEERARRVAEARGALAAAERRVEDEKALLRAAQERLADAARGLAAAEDEAARRRDALGRLERDAGGAEESPALNGP